MGLDIYFYKSKTARQVSLCTTDDIEELEKERMDNLMTDELKEIRAKALAIIQADEQDCGEKLLELLSPIITFSFFRDVFQNSERDRYLYWVNEIIGSKISHSDMYYRKVNFLYAYFADKLTDEQCIVTRSDVVDIIDKCKYVLENKDKAEETLPTQAGFFFGSTDYDEWYFKDVEDCLNQFEKFFEDWTDDTVAWVYFSW